jgi:hypothetical protein
MRLLAAHSEYMIRLGWLRVLARVAAVPNRRRSELGPALYAQASTQINSWLEESGLTIQPRGTISEKVAARIPGLAERYGVYDSVHEQLTDLGRTLLHVELLEPGAATASPFLWSRSLRYIGLRIVLGADGDLVLGLLRQWPESGVLTEPLSSIANVANQLLLHASSPDDVRELSRLARFAAEPKDKNYWTTVYPVLEPLRELGYLERRRVSDKPLARYHLTPAGARLRAEIVDTRLASADADRLLDQFLAHIFLRAEGIEPGVPADGEDLRETAANLPKMLLGGNLQEAPLEPVVLLTQVRLITSTPGRWMEMATAGEMLRTLGRVTEGRVGLKTGRMSYEANVFWTPPSSLEDPSLWRLPSSSPVAHPSSALGDPGGMPGGASPAETEPNMKADPAEPNRTPSAEHPPDGPVGAATPVLTPRINSPRLFLWLQYLGRRLEEPSLSMPHVFRHGGPWSWLTRLQHLARMEPKYLQNKREQHPLPWAKGSKPQGPAVPAIHFLHDWLETLSASGPSGAAPQLKPLRMVRDAWTDKECSPSLLHASLERAFAASTTDAPQVVFGELRKFLDGTRKGSDQSEDEEWHRIARLSDSLFEGAIERQWLVREDLLKCFHDHATDGVSQHLADALLGRATVALEPQKWMVRHSVAAPDAVLRFVRASKSGLLEHSTGSEERGDLLRVELAVPERQQDAPESMTVSQEASLEVTVELSTTSRALAIAHAKDVAWEALKRLQWLVTLNGEVSALEAMGVREEELPLVFDKDGNPVPGPESLDRNSLFISPELFPRVVRGTPSWSEVWKLPIERSAAGLWDDPGASGFDAESRLARTLHWMAAADQIGVRVPHRLSNVWVAMEHMIAEPEDDHGAAVARTLADVGALCHLRELTGATVIEMCEAMRRARKARGHDAAVQAELDNWRDRVLRSLGEEVYAVIFGSRVDPIGVPSQAGLELLLSADPGDITELAKVIEEDSPWAGHRLRFFRREILSSASALGDWIRATRKDIQSLVLHAYEVRNLLFHDGATFGFEESARLDGLYARFRLVANAVVGRFAGVVLNRPRRPTAAIWANLRHRTQVLLHAPDAEKLGTTVDREALRHALLD